MMSESKRPCSDQDPDYDSIVSNDQKRLKVIEKDNKEATIRKIESIIRTQFSKERQLKEIELDTIDERLYEARRMLDQLRACIVVSYYNADDLGASSSQRRHCSAVHPAIRKLLERISNSSSTQDKLQNVTSERVMTLSSKKGGRLGVTSGEERVPSVSENSAGVSLSVESCEDGGRGARFKLKKRIVVGNVSKYIPVDKREERDQSTHKWMIYVRGSKEEPRIDHFVKKVWFFLHPSYRPNDLVEVSQPPFHLTRRGWGEFPIRVQLQFHDSRNKRVDILHTLKLDKSYTGLQTLGAETMVDVLIYKPEMDLSLPPVQSSGECVVREETLSEGTTIDECAVSEITTEFVRVKEEPLDDSLPLIQPTTALNPMDCVYLPNYLKSEQILTSSNTAKVQSLPSTSAASNPTASSAQESSPSSSKLVTHGHSADLPTANGLSTFVKCADKRGNFFLIPMAMFLKLNSDTQASVIQSVVSATAAVNSNNVSSQSLKKWSSAPLVRLETSSPLDSPSSFTIASPDKSRNVVGASKRSVSLLSNAVTVAAYASPQKPAENLNSIVKHVNLSKLKNHVTEIPSLPVKLGNVANNHLSVKENRKNHRLFDFVVSKLSLDSFEFMDVIMKHILKYYPLVDPLNDKASRPYCCGSVAGFLSWNIGKRHAAEWQRSKAVRNKLLQLCTQCTKWNESQVWSVKNIMLFCRYYGYTPMKTLGVNSTTTFPSDVSTCTEASGLLDRLSRIADCSNDPVDTDEEEVDILTVENVTRTKSASSPVKSPTNNPSLLRLPSSPAGKFVRDAIEQIGVRVGLEETVTGVLTPLVEEVMLVATQSFMEDIMRASHAVAFQRKGNKGPPPSELTAIDVMKAVSQLRNCDFLTDNFMGTKMQKHHSLDYENVKL